MTQIFISYRRDDSRSITYRISERLIKAIGKNSIFVDIDSIPFGKDFRGELHEATAQCNIMLVVIGPKWLDIRDQNNHRRLDNPEDFVRQEVEKGLQRDGILVIPLLVEGARMPTVNDLPETLKELAYKNAYTIHDDPHFKHDIDGLIKEIRKSSGLSVALKLLLLIVTFLILSILALIVFSRFSAISSVQPRDIYIDDSISIFPTTQILTNTSVPTLTVVPSMTLEPPTATIMASPTDDIPTATPFVNVTETLSVKETSVYIETQSAIEIISSNQTQEAYLSLTETQIADSSTAIAQYWDSLTATIEQDTMFSRQTQIASTATAIYQNTSTYLTVAAHETRNAHVQETQQAVRTQSWATLSARQSVPTSTLIVSPTPTPTPTATFTAKSTVTDEQLSYPRTMYANINAVVRECASTTCTAITSMQQSDSAMAVREVEGSSFANNSKWYEVYYKGSEGYVHSSLLENTQDTATINTTQTVCNGSMQGTAMSLFDFDGRRKQSINASSGSEIEVTITVSNAEGAWGIKASLLNASQSELNAVEIFNTSTSEGSFKYRIPNTGTYYIQVSGDSTHKYNYRVRWVCN